MIPGTEGLGEQALNKIAQMALSAQLGEAEKLKIRVKTDPDKLAQGEVESLAIDGKGLVMQQDLRMQEIEIQMNGIAVSPLKALMGNIELTKPTEGTARIVLTEADINHAFNSEVLANQMRNLNIHVNDKLLTIDIQRVNCHLLANGKVVIDAEVSVQQTGETQQVSFATTPRISTCGRNISLEDVQYQDGKELSPELTNTLMEKARKILNLRNFEMQGILLQVHQLNVEAGKLTLEAAANITQFPSM